ncbi:MAG: DUF2752 domain-containing protein [Pseudonocardiales bacterium]|nr:MAG: DUF2752 domain-containing protein [Pseudonocardiales bacterium]
MSVDSAVRSDAFGSAALSRARQAPLRFGAGVLALAAADVAIDPMSTHVPLCPLHSITGWWCPFCGSLRAVAELAHGHVGAALRDNAVLVAAMPVAVALWWAWVLRVRAGGTLRRSSRRTTAGVLMVLVMFAVVRNLPMITALRPAS